MLEYHTKWILLFLRVEQIEQRLNVTKYLFERKEILKNKN